MSLTPPFAAYNGPEMHVFVCYAHADASIVYPEITLLTGVLSPKGQPWQLDSN